MRADFAALDIHAARAENDIALGIDFPLKRDVTAAGDCFRLRRSGLRQMLLHPAIVQRFAIRRIRPQRQAAHIEYTGRADIDTGIGEEIHVAADLVILDRIHDTINVDAVLD